MAELVHGKKCSILIGFLSGLYFAIRTAKMDRSRTDFTVLCFMKSYQNKKFYAKQKPSPGFAAVKHKKISHIRLTVP